VERGASSRSAPAAQLAAPPVSAPPAASRPARRTPSAPRPAPAKRRGSATLRPVQYALLKVDSDPWGVLYLDGARLGLTPIANHRLSLGTHRLRIEQKGYQTLTETIVVRGTGPVIRRYDLRRRATR